VIRALGLIACLCLLGSSTTQGSWREQLKADLVTVSRGKMILNDVGLYKIDVPGHEAAQVQVKIHSEAPAGGGIISRDNFVSLTTLLGSTVFVTALAASYQVPASDFLQHIDYTQLKSAIGTPDLELNITMTNEGMQFEVANTSSGQKNRSTMTWEQVFSK